MKKTIYLFIASVLVLPTLTSAYFAVITNSLKDRDLKALGYHGRWEKSWPCNYSK